MSLYREMRNVPIAARCDLAKYSLSGLILSPMLWRLVKISLKDQVSAIYATVRQRGPRRTQSRAQYCCFQSEDT